MLMNERKKIYRCDLCSKLYSDRDHETCFNNVCIKRYGSLYGDLCEECAKEFEKFVKERKEYGKSLQM